MPPEDAQPVVARPVAAGEFFVMEFPRPRLFRDGIAWAVSALPTTYAVDAQAAFRVNVELE